MESIRRILVAIQSNFQRHWKKYGIAAFLFFLLKGLFWLALGYFLIK